LGAVVAWHQPLEAAGYLVGSEQGPGSLGRAGSLPFISLQITALFGSCLVQTL